MSNAPQRNVVKARESGFGPFGQYINVGHHILGADEPGTYGGQDTGPDPFELVMAGLGACTTMTIRMVAGRKKIALKEVSVEVRHLRAPPMSMGADPATAEEKPHAFERIVTLTGDLSADDRVFLIAMADKCPVHKLLEGEAEIITREAVAEAA
ncbi:OsmC family protein [Pseudogemmobacter sonorensis]|uniref:OsmC family protein n=1 Tax=Pseudogemmobacter sonorensis TaxID=2989681 RepID=UPI00367A8F45